MSCAVLGFACTPEGDAEGPTTSVGDARDAGGHNPAYSGRPSGTVGGGTGSSSSQDAGSSTTGGGSSGARLSELSASELNALCDDIRATFEGEIPMTQLDALSCTFSALLVVDLERASGIVTVNRGQCQEHVADCLTFAAGTSRLRCETAAFRDASQDCDASAQDYRTCMEVGASLLADAVGVLTCENLSDATEAERAFQAAVGLDPAEHTECASLVARCPDLFGDGSRGEPAADGCDETCRDSDDGFCDDGGPDSQTSICALGTDCSDCGRR